MSYFKFRENRGKLEAKEATVEEIERAINMEPDELISCGWFYIKAENFQTAVTAYDIWKQSQRV